MRSIFSSPFLVYTSPIGPGSTLGGQVNPVLGLMIQFQDQDSATFFNCEDSKVADEVCGTLSAQKSRYDDNLIILNSSELRAPVNLRSHDISISDRLGSSLPKEICVKGFASFAIKFDTPNDFYVLSLKE